MEGVGFVSKDEAPQQLLGGGAADRYSMYKEKIQREREREYMKVSRQG